MLRVYLYLLAAEIATVELEKARLGYLEKVFDRGFKVVKVDMFLDSPALLLSEEWERVGKKAKSRDTFEATLFLRMSDGRASLASVGLFLENFLSEER